MFVRLNAGALSAVSNDFTNSLVFLKAGKRQDLQCISVHLPEWQPCRNQNTLQRACWRSQPWYLHSVSSCIE